jgi:acyl-CoA reductase-like NAD-dependent aldehyde dehydrogenase
MGEPWGKAGTWHQRATSWRAMAQDCRDAILQQQLLALAEEADDVAAEISADCRKKRMTDGGACQQATRSPA